MQVEDDFDSSDDDEVERRMHLKFKKACPYVKDDKIQVEYCTDGKRSYHGKKVSPISYYSGIIKRVKSATIVLVEFDSRRGRGEDEWEDVKVSDIVKKGKRSCTMDLKVDVYKEDTISITDIKKKPKLHVYLDTETYFVEEVLDCRTHDGMLELLIKWVGFAASENTWQRRSMLVSAIQQEGDDLIAKKIERGQLELRKLKRMQRNY